MEDRREERFHGSGYALGALGGVLLLLGAMATVAPLIIGLVGLTVGIGAIWTPMLLAAAGILLEPGHVALTAILVGSTLLAAGAWLARDLPVVDRA